MIAPAVRTMAPAQAQAARGRYPNGAASTLAVSRLRQRIPSRRPVAAAPLLRNLPPPNAMNRPFPDHPCRRAGARNAGAR